MRERERERRVKCQRVHADGTSLRPRRDLYKKARWQPVVPEPHDHAMSICLYFAHFYLFFVRAKKVKSVTSSPEWRIWVVLGLLLPMIFLLPHLLSSLPLSFFLPLLTHQPHSMKKYMFINLRVFSSTLCQLFEPPSTLHPLLSSLTLCPAIRKKRKEENKHFGTILEASRLSFRLEFRQIVQHLYFTFHKRNIGIERVQ